VNLSGIDERYIRELIRNHQHPFVIEFYADWCGPCKQMAPMLDELDKTVDVLKINIEEQPALAREYGIQSIPSLLFIRDGEIRKTATGAMSQEDLRDFVGN